MSTCAQCGTPDIGGTWCAFCHKQVVAEMHRHCNLGGYATDEEFDPKRPGASGIEIRAQEFSVRSIRGQKKIYFRGGLELL